MQNFRLFADQYEGNPEPNLAEYAHAGHVFYAHKATEGVAHVDAAHIRRARHAHEQGLTVMHYHFCRPDQRDPVREMRQFWNVSRLSWLPGDFVALDFEPESGHDANLWTPGYLESVWDHLHATTTEGARVYGSTSFLAGHAREVWLRKRPVWAAQYGNDPGSGSWGRHWWAWQRSDGAVGPEPHTLAGIGVCDVSQLNMVTALALAVRARRRRWRRHN